MYQQVHCTPATDTSQENTTTLKDAWSIRPCEVYKDEYDNCTSFKARFHQYFIDGQNTDCTQWQTDYTNCQRYEDSNGRDLTAGEAVVNSEKARRLQRMKAHYANNTWNKRQSPPEDWSKPLPDWLAKRNENTYLELKQKELEGKGTAMNEEPAKYCIIM